MLVKKETQYLAIQGQLLLATYRPTIGPKLKRRNLHESQKGDITAEESKTSFQFSILDDIVFRITRVICSVAAFTLC